MMQPSPDLRRTLAEHGQEHVLADFDSLPDAKRSELIAQLEAIDFAELRGLFDKRNARHELFDFSRIEALPRPNLDASRRSQYAAAGESALAEGTVAYLVVAGGQGSRLGFEHPKGMFEIGPVSRKSLFAMTVEKIVALQRRHRQKFPLLVMTSPATDDETRRYFASQGNFGLPAESLHFFIQGTMPALDWETGRLIMQERGQLFLSPNGHGGTLTGLAERDRLLAQLADRGIRTLFYFQIDNPFVRLADTVFLGQHLALDAEVSTKVIEKRHPTEKLGNLVLYNDRCTIVEYSDLPLEVAQRTNAQGLQCWAGNSAIHLFDVAFLQRMIARSALPWHLARKKVPFLDEHGKLIQPEKENALKAERFIFDVLPHADRWTVMPITRAEEFEPLKNAEGSESPATVRQGLIDRAGTWLEQAGVKVPRDAGGHVATPIEIAASFALEASDVPARLDAAARTQIERQLTAGDPVMLE